jgi:hypothetical protein
MSSRLAVTVIVVTVLNLVFVLELVRRRQLREKYALLWLAVGVTGLFLAVARPLLDGMARSLGIEYGPSALFFFAIMFLLLVAAHLSWEVSRLEDRTRRLAEELALMQVKDPEPPRAEAPAEGAADTAPG